MQSLNERYHEETGLHSHYRRKHGLAYTRHYVEWLEIIIKNARNCIVCASISNPMEAAENTYKILEGNNK